MKSIKSLKKETTRLSKYDWMMYARSYLKMAQIGIEELKNQKYIDPGLDRIFFYEEKLILIPVIWNLKHAIELIIKTLGITIDKQYFTEHNLDILKVDLEKSLKELGIEKPKKIEDLAIIIDKYYKCEFWNKKLIKTGNVFDVKNDIFRYPESKTSFKSNILQILKDIPFNDEARYSRETEELSDDIKELKSLLGIISAQIERSKFKRK